MNKEYPAPASGFRLLLAIVTFAIVWFIAAAMAIVVGWATNTAPDLGAALGSLALWVAVTHRIDGL